MDSDTDTGDARRGPLMLMLSLLLTPRLTPGTMEDMDMDILTMEDTMVMVWDTTMERGLLTLSLLLLLMPRLMLIPGTMADTMEDTDTDTEDTDTGVKLVLECQLK